MNIVSRIKAHLGRTSKAKDKVEPESPTIASVLASVVATAPRAPSLPLPLPGTDWKGLQKELGLSFEEHQSLANQGVAESQYEVGLAYATGAGTTVDHDQAYRWFAKAAAQGLPKALFRVAAACEFGIGTAPDIAKAFASYDAAATAGYAEAQFSLALLYLNAKGVAKDTAKALWYLEKAANQDHTRAQFNLASLYCGSDGVEQNLTEAVHWYQKAAQAGHPRANHNLGVLFSKGLGVPKNPGQAVVHFARAAAQGHEAAERNLNEILGELQTLPIAAPTSVRVRPEANSAVAKNASVGEQAYIVSTFGLWHEVYFTDRHIVGFITTVQVPEVPETPEPQKRIEVSLAELRDRRLLPPLEQDHRINNEFRAIKRVLLGNMAGRTEKPEDGGNLVMVSSALSSEGKTVCTLNLALSLALERDFTVTLVDADVINPTISRCLGVEQEPGLLDVLRTPDGDLRDVEIGTGIAGLSVVPAGRRDQDAPELMSSNRMSRLVAMMKAQPNRIFLFDSTPILLTQESRSLSEMVGQIVFVVRAGVTPRNAVKTALTFIPKDTYTGLVLNHKSGSDHGEAYYYYYDYYKPATDGKRDNAA